MLRSDPADLVHKYLVHPNLSKLQQMVPILSSLSKLDCESCQLEKNIRVTFLCGTEGRSKSMFSLVHYDIWILEESVRP